MTTRLSSLDWDDFDPESPELKKFARHLYSHARMRGPVEKHWLAPGLLAEGELSVIFGPAGVGKSMLAIDLACRLAAGIGWDGGETDFKFSVLYVAAERPANVRRRADAFFKDHGLDKESGLVVYDGPLDLSQRNDDLTAIVKMAGTVPVEGDFFEPHLVVIDTLSAAMSAPDSSTEATAAVTDNIRRAQRATGAHVCVITHPPISDPTRARGGHITGAADTTIRVSSKRGIITAQVEKNNDTPERPALHYTLKSVKIGEPVDGIETTAAVVVPCNPPKAANGNRRQMNRSARSALDTLQKAIEANGGPVSEEQWRAAVYAEADDITDAAKRQRYSRARAAASEHVIEEKGLFAILDRVTDRDVA